MKINVFTLNCWGIPFVSKDRIKRMEAIAEYLSKGTQEIVCLQEVWDKKDFINIREKTCNVLPYSHYFYSGVCGSGVCILSKWPIEEVFFHAWALNGYFHMVHHGDWWGGKGVGLCRIKCGNINVNVYSAHLHAEYSTEDIYFAHRVLQAFNTAEFVKLTSHDADLVVLAGDLNTQPNDLAFRLICETGLFNDTCIFNKNDVVQDKENENKIIVQGTNERACNSYTNPLEAIKQPEGKRIDYILYHPGKQCNVNVLNYDLPLSGKVPGCSFSYSDHDAVAAQLEVIKIEELVVREYSKEFVTTLGNAISVCEDAMNTLRHSAYRYLLYALSLFVLLLCTVGMAERTVVDLPRLLIVVVMFYFLFMGTIWNCMEHNGVIEGKQAMEIVHKRLKENN